VDYYAQGSLVAAVVALAIAVYLRVGARRDAEARAFADLSFVIFLWCLPEYLWKTLGSVFWHRASVAAVMLIPPFAVRYCAAAVPSPPRWYALAFAAGLAASAAFVGTVFFERLFASPWWNVAALVYVYAYLALALYVVVRHGFGAGPSSVERKKYQFLLVGGGIASLVAPLNFLPGAGIPVPPVGSFAILLFFYFMATGILHLHFFEFPDLVGRAIVLVIQVFAFAVVFGVLEVASGRRFWFPLAGTFLVAFFVLTFYPAFMRRLGAMSSELFVRESRSVQALLGDWARRLADCGSLPEIGRAVEEALSRVSFVAQAALWLLPEPGLDEGLGRPPVRPEEYARAWARAAKRYPAMRFLEHGGSRAAQVALWDDTWHASCPLFLRDDLAGAVLFRWSKKIPSIREMELLVPFLSGIPLAVENLRQRQRIARKEHLATVGELAAALAHEVRTPAGAIKGAAQYLRRGAPPQDREFLDIIVEEADRLDGVVRGFLEYARPGRRSPRTFFLREAAERALARLRRERDGALDGVLVSLLGEDPGPQVTADPDGIERVVFNLAANAVEAMPGGGTLAVRIGSDGGLATLCVEDTGRGILEADRPHLFRPFFTTREGGVGMGLAVCRRIVEEHGGTISAESAPGRGSRFTVRLPPAGGAP